MLLIRKRARARAGLVGNPSDGYGGKTISAAFDDFFAEVVLYEWDEVEIVISRLDQVRFRSVEDLYRDVKLHGYYGGIRLVKATIKRFVEHCRRQQIPLHDRTFSVRYDSNIPRQVGLAGSSAIIVATLRCLIEFYGVNIPREVQPSLALAVEAEELGIAAGLQDRVAQVYDGLTYMDFAPEHMVERCGLMHGRYEPLEMALLPPIYLAFSAEVSEPTEVFHSNLRARFQAGEPAVVEAMRRFAALAEEAREALLCGEAERLGALMDANFDLRRSICRLPREHVEMIERARAAGGTAKFAGSGGAIVGTYPDEAAFRRIEAALTAIGCRVLRPRWGRG